MLPFLKKKRVLLLDDDPAMQRLMSAVLRDAGYRVEIVSSGTQAIQKLGRVQYDALLLDLMTPTDGGMTVIRHLKKAAPGLLRRALLVTASPETVVKSIALDVAGVVHKPFEKDELVGAVKRVTKD